MYHIFHPAQHNIRPKIGLRMICATLNTEAWAKIGSSCPRHWWPQDIYINEIWRFAVLRGTLPVITIELHRECQTMCSHLLLWLIHLCGLCEDCSSSLTVQFITLCAFCLENSIL